MVPISRPRTLIVVATLAALLRGAPVVAQHTAATAPCPHGRIKRVLVETGDVFAAQAGDPALVRLGAGFANLLHLQTRRDFVRSELLFHEGDCLDSLRLAESQRLLAGYSFIRDARITVERDSARDAVARVVTRDEWSTLVDVGIVYDQGLRPEDVQVNEINFLGTGVSAELKRVERRERRDQFYAVTTPRFFGRSDARFYYGRSRGGDFFGETISYPFLGETSRTSISEAMSRNVDFVTYAADSGQLFSHFQVPTRREFGEIAAAKRFGPPGRGTILGVGFSHERWRVAGQPLLITSGDFDDGATTSAALPAPIARQMGDGALTLAGVQLGVRRFRYAEMLGLDAVRDIQIVDVGYNAGITLAKGIAVGAGNLPALTDTYGRLHASFGRQLRASLVHGSITSQAGHSPSGWRDVLTDAELVGYGRADWLPEQTLFLRLSAGGGWNMRTPHQLTLGGRDGVRSLLDDEIPGSRRFVVFLEDRVRLGWPDWSALDLGMTLFADAGRTWAGDSPFGSDSPWLASIGAGLRLGLPRGTHSALRPDIVYPLGRRGQPIFRVTYEVNRYGYRFATPKLGRGQPRLRGPESF